MLTPSTFPWRDLGLCAHSNDDSRVSIVQTFWWQAEMFIHSLHHPLEYAREMLVKNEQNILYDQCSSIREEETTVIFSPIIQNELKRSLTVFTTIPILGNYDCPSSSQVPWSDPDTDVLYVSSIIHVYVRGVCGVSLVCANVWLCLQSSLADGI